MLFLDLTHLYFSPLLRRVANCLLVVANSTQFDAAKKVARSIPTTLWNFFWWTHLLLSRKWKRTKKEAKRDHVRRRKVSYEMYRVYRVCAANCVPRNSRLQRTSQHCHPPSTTAWAVVLQSCNGGRWTALFQFWGKGSMGGGRVKVVVTKRRSTKMTDASGFRCSHHHNRATQTPHTETNNLEA